MRSSEDTDTVLLPRPYEDEPLYGVVARYAKLLAIPWHMRVSHAVFGDNRVVSIDLPTGLGVAARRCRLGLGLDVAGIIAELTLAPLHLSYVEEHVETACHLAMATRATTSVANLLGIAASRVPRPSELRFCPKCVAEQRARFGECHWRRAHQIGGVLACADHGCLLVASSAPFRMAGDRHLHDADDVIPHGGELDRSFWPADASMVMVARRCCEILAGRSSASPGKRHRWERADSHRLRSRVILSEFRRFFGAGNLRAMGCDVCPENPQDWPLVMLTRGSARHHAIQHVLLDLFGENTACLVERSEQPPPPAHVSEPPSRDQEVLAAMARWSRRHDGSAEHVTAEGARERRRTYDFLERRVPGWLRNQRAYNRRPMNQRRVDWSKRDVLWEELLLSSISVVKSARPARRLTRSALIAAAGLPTGTASSLGKLPRCEAVIESAIETVGAFECRKITDAATELEANGCPVTATDVRRLTGLTGPITTEARALLRFVQGREKAM